MITSAANPVVKRARSLADRRTRRREGAFLVEGLQPVWRAVESGWGIDTLITAPGLLTRPEAVAMVERQRAAGVPVAELSDDVFARLSERDGPTGLAAIVTIPSRTLADLAPAGRVVLGLERPSNPGNLGTIIRTADAAGVGAILLLGDATDPFAPAAVKASMGSVFAVPVVATSVAAALAWARERGLATVATSGAADASLFEADLPERALVLMGNEGDGLPADVVAGADLAVRIPMTGTAESLNLAVATALVLYEFARR